MVIAKFGRVKGSRDVLDLMQHVVAKTPELDLLSALVEAKGLAGASKPGAHWALTQAAGRPVLQWEYDENRTVEAKLQLIEMAKGFV